MAASAPPKRRRGWPDRVWHSYRGRYLLASLVVACLLLAISLAGNRHVERIRDGQLKRIQDRAQASALLEDAAAQLHELQTRLQGFLLDPNAATGNAVDVAQSRLAASVQRLGGAAWLAANPDTAALVTAVAGDVRRLRGAVRELSAIRLRHESWFPAMRILQEEMHPRNREARRLADDIMLEAGEEPLADLGAELLTAAVELRLAWTDLTLEFRLLVANRLGVFASDATAGMTARANNMRLHAERVRAALARIRKLAAVRPSGLLTELAVPRSEVLLEEWLQAFARVQSLLLRDDWRNDLRYLRTQITPTLENIDRRLSAVDIELDTHSAREITRLTQSAEALSDAITALAVAFMLVVAAGYLTFSRTVLAPVFATTRALKREAMGRRDAAPPAATTSELRDLVDAFELMRRQVHERQAHLDHIAHHDALTGLPNRILFRDRVEHALALTQRRGRLLGVLFLDLDRFKQVNDSLGHRVGDELLVAVAERLREQVRRSDTVARLSGDEFALLVEAVHARDELAALAEKILLEFRRPFQAGTHELHVTASLGIAVGPDDGATPDDLLRDADAAMYEAKRHGRAGFRFFSADLTQRAGEHLAMENAMRAAVAARQFRVHYQPVCRAAGGPPVFYEALLRWAHPTGVLVQPGEFLATLDDTGLIEPVTDWLIRQIGTLLQRLPAETAVAVNLSAPMLQDHRFTNGLLHQFDVGQLPASRLILEITEDSLGHQVDAVVATLADFKAHGVRIALDDFGTGQSSLSHLRRFAFDLLKIDRAFVTGVTDDERDARLVRATIRLAQSFDLQVVAEGVEHPAQLAFLQAEGCDLVQGYLLGRPEPAEALVPARESSAMPARRA